MGSHADQQEDSSSNSDMPPLEDIINLSDSFAESQNINTLMHEVLKEQNSTLVKEKKVIEETHVQVLDQLYTLQCQLNNQKQKTLEDFVLRQMKARGMDTAAETFKKEANIIYTPSLLSSEAIDRGKKFFDVCCQVRHGTEPINVLKPLFKKELSTASDYIILELPKEAAEEWFCRVLAEKENKEVSAMDEDGKVWTFKFLNFKYGNVYFLTSGWSKFVEEKGLKISSIVEFMYTDAGNLHVYTTKAPVPSEANI